jgi:hypothetical protein
MRKHTPIYRHIVKSYPSPRGSYDEPLLHCLRSKYHKTHAVGFKERLVASDDDFYPEVETTPIGFIEYEAMTAARKMARQGTAELISRLSRRGLTRTKP